MPVRVLLDTNIWRYILDGNALPVFRAAVRRSKRVVVCVAPAVLYEAAQTTDDRVRRELLCALTEPWWKRLMPEAFSEAEELKGEIRRLRRAWLKVRPQLQAYNRLRHDWRRKYGGLWDRMLADVTLLRALEAESGLRDAARDQARAQRAEAANWAPELRSIPLTTVVARLPVAWDGWDGEPFEPWRFDAYTVLRQSLQTPGHPTRDWLQDEIELQLLLYQPASHLHFWLNEVEVTRMPRHWLRWAFEFLQRQHRISDGTPADAQLGTYLLEADLLLSADKRLVSIAEKCRADAPFGIAESKLLPGGPSAVENLLEMVEA